MSKKVSELLDGVLVNATDDIMIRRGDTNLRIAASNFLYVDSNGKVVGPTPDPVSYTSLVNKPVGLNYLTSVPVLTLADQAVTVATHFLPGSNGVLNLGSVSQRFASIFAASSLLIGSTAALSRTSLILDADPAATAPSGRPTILASALMAKPFSYAGTSGTVTVPPALSLLNSADNAYSLSLNLSTNAFSFNTPTIFGGAALVAGSLSLGNVGPDALRVVGGIRHTGDYANSNVGAQLSHAGTTTLGTLQVTNASTFSGSAAFTNAVSLGGGASPVTINSGTTQPLTITASNLTADANGVEVGGSLTVRGNLNVIGDINRLSSNEIHVGDSIIVLNSEISSTDQPTVDAGIIIKRGAYVDAKWLWDETNTRFTSSGANIGDIGVISAQGFTGPLTGTASSAQKLLNSRLIAGHAFDGTSDISISTNDVAEGANLYFRMDRARAAITVSGSLSYNTTSGVISYTAPVLSAVASSGSYGDLINRPSIPSKISDLTNDVGFTTIANARSSISASGSLVYDQTTGVISYTAPTLAPVALSGAYADLTGKPSIPSKTSSLTNDSGFITVNAARAAISVTGSLTYDGAAGVISYTAPTLAPVALSGAYADLTGKPSIPSKTSSLTNDSGFIGISDARAALSVVGSLTYNSTTGVISYSAPVLAAIATSGSYNDLINVPTTDGIVEGSSNLYFTAGRARSVISAGGSLSYNATTGVISYAAPTQTIQDVNNASAINNVGTIVKRDASGNFAAATITATLSGNATTASALLNPRAFAFVGDASGSTTFDGSADTSINLTLASTAVTAGSYGSTTTVGTFTVDSKGRLVAATSAAIAFPVTSVFGRTGSVALTSSDVVGALGFTPVNPGSSAVTLAGDVTVGGNLIVNGSSIVINSTQTTLTDPVITLGSGSTVTADGKDRGIEFRYGDGTAIRTGFFGYDVSSGNFLFLTAATNSSEVFTGTTGTITANLSGNASSASKLIVPRTLAFTGDASASGTFDGSANFSSALTLAITGVSAGSYGSATSVASYTVDTKGRLTSASNVAIAFPVTSVAGRTGAITIASADITDAASASTASTLVKRDASGNFSAGTITATLAGNAATATSAGTASTLATARTIAFTGDATGSTSFDGSANTSTALTLASTSVAAGSYGSSTAVATFAVDSKGRLTAATSTAIAFPVTSVAGRTGSVTIASADITDATSAATASTLIKRDSNGSFSTSSLALSGSLSFGARLGQIANFYNSTYGLGIQSSTLYLRTDGEFDIHLSGVHSNTQGDPGAGGTNLLRVSASTFTYLGQTIWNSGNFTPTNYATAGANSNITSLSGLSTALSQAQGGTGASTLASATVTATGGTASTLAALLVALDPSAAGFQSTLVSLVTQMFKNLPTTLPTNQGTIWNNSGVLSIS